MQGVKRGPFFNNNSGVNMKNHNKFFIRLCVSVFVCLFVFNNNVKAQEGNNNSANRDSIIGAAREMIGSLKYCALITMDSTGGISVRTMNPFPPEEDMSVWMATNKHTRKYFEIKKNPNVALYYADHSKADGYVAIKGTAILVDDMTTKLKMKRDYWDQAFPDFNDLILIKVVPERLEIIYYKHKLYNAKVTWDPPSAEFNNR